MADCPHYFVGVGEHLVHNSTKFKATGTQRFKRIRKFVKYFRRRYILTGSFTPNGLLDLFGQIYILDEGSSLGSYVSHYKTKYFYATDFMGYNLAPHPWAPKEIAEKIAPLTLVMEREGNIVMPELLPTHDIVVELPPAVRQQYEATWNSMLTLLESGDLIISKNAAVATSKCRQIANGFVFHDRDKDPGGWTDLHSAKIEALRELIDELSGEPLLVCYEFKPDLEKLQAAFPEACLLTSGNAKRDDEAISIFKAGMMKVALAQITSISLGIDGLQNNCYNVCMYAITWNLQDYSQAIDRVWRPGQTSGHVSVHRIITKDTVDERVLKVLNNKEAVQTDFLTLLKGART